MEERRGHIRLYFEEKGKGDNTFVLIHGSGGDHRQLQPQIERLSQIGRVLAVDLRGHGQSDKPEEDYSIESFADDIYWLCQKRNVKHPILIGFSMGGNIAIELAAEHPGFAKALIILDSAFLYTEMVQKVIQGFSHGLKADPKACIEQIVENGSLPTDRLKKEILHNLLKTPAYVWFSTFENMLKWDKKAAHQIKRCTLPILYIEAANQLVDMPRFKELCPHLIQGKIVGTGHFLPLEVPDQVNPMIERYLSTYIPN